VKQSENNEILKQVEFALKLDEKTRGSYLFQAIWIDTLLKQIIAQHFCPNDYKKQGMLIGTILNDLTLNLKIKHFLRILELYPKIKSKHLKIKKKLENVRELRNKFAHSQLDTSAEFLSKKADYIRLIEYKDGKKNYYNITSQIIQAKNAEIAKLHFELNEIISDMTGGKLGKLVPIGKLDS